MKTIKLVGYWNGSEVKPEITFNPPSVEEQASKKLVLIQLQELPDNRTYNLKEDIEKNVKSISKNAQDIQKSLNHSLNLLKKLK